MLPRFQFRVDQITVHSDLIGTSIGGDQVDILDDITILFLKSTLQTEGSGYIVSRNAVFNRNTVHQNTPSTINCTLV